MSVGVVQSVGSLPSVSVDASIRLFLRVVFFVLKVLYRSMCLISVGLVSKTHRRDIERSRRERSSSTSNVSFEWFEKFFLSFSCECTLMCRKEGAGEGRG